MKKITIMLALMFTLTTTWAFTGEKSIRKTAMKYQGGNHTTYYVTLENADTKTELKSINGRDWSVYQRDRK